MTIARFLQVTALLFGFSTVPALSIAQGKDTKDKPARAEPVKELFGGTADHWLQALIHARESIETSIYLDRLSYFQLTTTQLKQLIAAAEQESSDEKKIVLWQALRQSRDTRGRDYLLKALVEKSSPETQLQFIDQMRNLSRFDVPILLALYKKHRLGKNAESTPIANAGTDFGDLFDISERIADLACHTSWTWLNVTTAWTGEDFLNNPKWHESKERRGEEAQLAREEMVVWLIKNGLDDRHRINAFRSYLSQGVFSKSRKSYVQYGEDLLSGMNSPESKAEAMLLARNWIEPSRYLRAGEVETVRLAAIEVMHVQAVQAVGALYFGSKVATYRPILNKVQQSDPSPKVKAAAKRLENFLTKVERDSANPIGQARR